MPRYVTQDGASLYYELYATDPGRPLVMFLSGLGQSARDWQHIRKFLEDVYSVLLVDARGQGRASPGRELPTLDVHCRDAAALLSDLRISGANLAGVSLGGHIALGLAGRHPDLVRAAAVSGLGADYGPRVRLILSSWIQTLQNRGMTAWARAVLPLVFGEGFLKSHEGTLKQIEASLVKRNDSVSLLRQMQTLLQYPNPREQAEAVRCPVLVQSCDDDPLLGSGQAEELARICRAETRHFSGAGHTLPAEAPEEYAHSLREFFG